MCRRAGGAGGEGVGDFEFNIWIHEPNVRKDFGGSPLTLPTHTPTHPNDEYGKK